VQGNLFKNTGYGTSAIVDKNHVTGSPNYSGNLNGTITN
jgi:hypothetical protein